MVSQLRDQNDQSQDHKSDRQNDQISPLMFVVMSARDFPDNFLFGFFMILVTRSANPDSHVLDQPFLFDSSAAFSARNFSRVFFFEFGFRARQAKISAAVFHPPMPRDIFPADDANFF